MSSLRIVHCANFSESKNGAVYYAIDRKLSNGLIRNGHFVYDFSYREIAKNSNIFKSKKFGIKKVNENLIEVIKNIKPHLLLLGHSELISHESLEKIKAILPDIKIAMWWVDPFDKIEHIYKRLEIVDVFFATTGISKLREIFGNVSAKLLFFPNPCDKSIENIKSYEKKEYEFDLIYIGRNDNRRKDFIDKLKDLKDLKIALFGNSKDNLIYGAKYYDTISNSKIALNFSRYNDIDMYSSDRIIQLTSNGILTMSPRIPKYELLFSENEVVYFDSYNDFKEKLYFYLENDNKRREIAKNGYLKAHESFNSTRVSKYMLESIFEPNISQKYEWEIGH